MTALGIDLGTTNTVLATAMEVLRFREEGSSTAILGSVVAYPPSGATLVGSAARRRRALDAKNTIFSAKRLLATPWHSHRTNEFRTQYPFELTQTKDGLAAFKTRAGTVTPVNVGTTIISALCQRTSLKPSELDAVVTVPAEFDQAQRDATVAAVNGADIPRVRILDEPIATAMAYLRRSHGSNQRVAVYDLGGGTFDFAVLEFQDDSFSLLQHGGDRYLGGDDLDRRIALWVADRTLRHSGWDLSSDAEVFDRLVTQCERAKIALSNEPTAEINLTQVDPAAPPSATSVVVDQPLFNQLAIDLVRRTFSICDEVLRDIGVRAQTIDEVFLAGGTTQIPIVRQSIAKYFGVPPRCDFDPMEVVGIGASLAAADPKHPAAR